MKGKAVIIINAARLAVAINSIAPINSLICFCQPFILSQSKGLKSNLYKSTCTNSWKKSQLFLGSSTFSILPSHSLICSEFFLQNSVGMKRLFLNKKKCYGKHFHMHLIHIVFYSPKIFIFRIHSFCNRLKGIVQTISVGRIIN